MDTKIKLLIVEPVSDLGGVSQYVLSTTRFLPRDKYDIHVAASGKGPLFDLARQDNVSTHSLAVDYSVSSFVQAIFSFRAFIKAEQFDVIHAHTAKAGFLCCIANRGLRAKIIYMGHGFRFDQKKNPVAKLLFYWLERFVCGSSDYVALESKTEYDVGVTKGLLREENRAGIAPMSIDVGGSANSPSVGSLRGETMREMPGTFVVGMVGRVTYQKDPATFVRAAAVLNSSIRGVRFLWVGDGDLRNETMRMANGLGLSSKMIITGQRDSREIPMLLSEMDVLLFTSRFEGLPTALLEAMAARKIIVAADVGSVKDVITNGVTGWLFPAGDFKQAASIIENIYRTRSELNHIGGNARELIMRMYSPQDKMARAFQRIYEHVLSSK